MLSSKSVRSHPPISYYYFHIGPLMIENDPNTRLHITDCPHLFSEVYLLLAEKIWMTKILLFDDRSISLFRGGQLGPGPNYPELDCPGPNFALTFSFHSFTLILQWETDFNIMCDPKPGALVFCINQFWRKVCTHCSTVWVICILKCGNFLCFLITTLRHPAETSYKVLLMHPSPTHRLHSQYHCYMAF